MLFTRSIYILQSFGRFHKIQYFVEESKVTFLRKTSLPSEDKPSFGRQAFLRRTTAYSGITAEAGQAGKNVCATIIHRLNGITDPAIAGSVKIYKSVDFNFLLFHLLKKVSYGLMIAFNTLS